ncbi:hypothetical protein Tco_0574593, partial [Tanacetum coccineum]
MGFNRSRIADDEGGFVGLGFSKDDGGGVAIRFCFVMMT